MLIPQVTYSNYFGPVSKVRWYKVTENYSEYDVELFITTNQNRATQVRIENRSASDGIEWSERIPANVTQETINRDLQLLHVPNLKAREYVVINQSIT